MKGKLQSGFSLLETMIALTVLSAVGGIVMTGMVQMMKTQGGIANRTEMHTSVRSATELLSQEVGQAGKVALPNPSTPVTLNGAVLANAGTITVSNSAGMFDLEQLTLDDGANQEEVTIASGGVSGNSLTLVTNIVNPHPDKAPINALGGFAAGIVPPDSSSTACASAGYTATTNGSTCSILKMFGDLNGDGNMVYVEYTCDTANGILYRQQLNWNDPHSSKIGTSPTATQEASMALLTNITANPGAVPCFNYQVQQVGTNSYVTDVAITLTAQTPNVDPVTRQLQSETKSLLNVSPRNVYDAYSNASLGFNTRVQPMPPTIAALLP
jgi:prepilin-type N-terminal cleavage/methylation domain-containing protein